MHPFRSLPHLQICRIVPARHIYTSKFNVDRLWACGAPVARSLCMRKVRGSAPCLSNHNPFFLTYSFCRPANCNLLPSAVCTLQPCIAHKSLLKRGLPSGPKQTVHAPHLAAVLPAPAQPHAPHLRRKLGRLVWFCIDTNSWAQISRTGACIHQVPPVSNSRHAGSVCMHAHALFCLCTTHMLS